MAEKFTYPELLKCLAALTGRRDSMPQVEIQAFADELARMAHKNDLVSVIMGCGHNIEHKAAMIEHWVGRKGATPKKWAAAIREFRFRQHVCAMALARQLDPSWPRR